MQIKDLKPAGYNPRKITDEKLAMLKKSLDEFGDLSGVVYNRRTGTLIGGHQRIKTLDPSWPITIEDHTDNTGTVASGYIETSHGRLTYREVDWPETKEKAANIAANKHGGEFDNDLLRALVDELRLNDTDMDLIGFDTDEINELMESGGPEEPRDAEPQIDRAEELNQIWGVKPGDLWQIGEHRLLCGDSTKKEDVRRVMGEEKADIVFTDPPYGVSYGDKNKYLNAISPGNRIQTHIVNDHKTPNELAESVIYPAFCRIREILAPRSSYYITAPQGGELLMMMMMMMQKAGLILRHMIIWVKNNHVLGRTDYNYKHEPILFGWVGVHDFYGKGDYKFSTWEIPKPLKSELHPTMKPVALVVNAILNSCPESGLLADLFGGSGTSMVACENTGRRCRMIELTAGYCAVILQRMTDAFPGIEIKRIN